MVYLRVKEPIIGAKGIEIEVKGGIKNSFKKFNAAYYSAALEESKVKNLKTTLKRSRKFLSHSSMVYKFKESVVAPGDYLARFKFTLPKVLPSSIYFKNTEKEDAPKVKVKYFCKARLVCDENPAETQ